jgi:hypothetical protein
LKEWNIFLQIPLACRSSFPLLENEYIAFTQPISLPFHRSSSTSSILIPNQQCDSLVCNNLIFALLHCTVNLESF